MLNTINKIPLHGSVCGWEMISKMRNDYHDNYANYFSSKHRLFWSHEGGMNAVQVGAYKQDIKSLLFQIQIADEKLTYTVEPLLVYSLYNTQDTIQKTSTLRTKLIWMQAIPEEVMHFLLWSAETSLIRLGWSHCREFPLYSPSMNAIIKSSSLLSLAWTWSIPKKVDYTWWLA